ncbi:diacylglycerol kinase family protein [Halococcus sp. IIIV-5B]|uniref:diacylglycerol/lipid kinase family protein n=1 Tax=Halococcus sp. IIIV-5B TaxID=2321230 RepID=UPI000E72DA4F|nr:diacylglycerol kinase family protein [Halococcus sp. IIIV-5B]RJS97435.1 diacylglycerol kinase family lipid kinase [Halococcus sp. IIIV-5B]
MTRSSGHEPTDGPPGPDANRRVIVNPNSGAGDHLPTIRRLADRWGYSVAETAAAGDAIRLAREAAADGVDVLAACGGDGTVHEVLCGLVDADALGGVRFGVVPVGTANIFADDIGVRGVEHGFELLEEGEVRRIDLGTADGVPFVKSCIAGLTADTSAATTSDLKARFGPLAFVITGVQQAREFEALDIEVDAVTDEGPRTWSGEALCVLIGNARRFAKQFGQANVEDGLFDVTLIERMPAGEAVAEAIAQQLLRRDTEHVTRLQAERLTVESRSGAIDFSLDGEIYTRNRLDLRVRSGVLSVCVGADYEPNPTTETDEDPFGRYL